jgi:acyl-coenzyme A thioesterase PaaI-like protein
MHTNNNNNAATAEAHGLEVFGEPGGFVHRNGPVYIDRRTEIPVVSMLLTSEHTNSMGIASGGLLMMLLDIGLGTAVSAKVGTKSICPTVQINCNLMASGKVGDRIICETEISSVTRSLAFANGKLVGPGGVIATATGVFKIPSHIRKALDSAAPGARRDSKS